ncbi:MAG: CoA-acylating methylmalonate-semialdehyde dehydrogenase [Firmicutes bacterium]|nr:CoA-acylating methylmalonate-semialdehyde dehydrogenase [Bacillota bacterium]
MAVERLKFCVGGEWLDTRSGKYMPVTDSSTGEVIAETPCCTAEEVNAAVEAAVKTFPEWSATPVTDRAQVMFRFKAKLEEHLDELARMVSVELGKNVNEARGDVIKAIEGVELATAVPITMQGRSLMQVSRGFDTVTYREPLGVFVGIAPFNFPAMIPFGWMIPVAIATGNTFVLKAASPTPMTSNRILHLLYEAGLPEGVVNWVTCTRNEAELLLKHPGVKGITYVGSTSVGRLIYKTSAEHGKRVQVLGEAKNHGLVLRDANIEQAARVIINSTYGCAGMRCMALPVVCVEEAVADEFVGYLKRFAQELKVGCAYDPATELGPVVSAEHKKSVSDWIAKGVEEGAELVLDGRGVVVKGYEGGFFLGPTILDHVKPGMSVGDKEIFGPVTCIKRVRDFEHGLDIMNASEFANGSCIFTESGREAREFIRRTHGGMVGVNVGIPVPISVFPFSGHKNSFFGDLHVLGMDGLAFYTETKSVTTRWFGRAAKAEKVGTWEGTITRT